MPRALVATLHCSFEGPPPGPSGVSTPSGGQLCPPGTARQGPPRLTQAPLNQVLGDCRSRALGDCRSKTLGDCRSKALGDCRSKQHEQHETIRRTPACVKSAIRATIRLRSARSARAIRATPGSTRSKVTVEAKANCPLAQMRLSQIQHDLVERFGPLALSPIQHDLVERFGPWALSRKDVQEWVWVQLSARKSGCSLSQNWRHGPTAPAGANLRRSSPARRRRAAVLPPPPTKGRSNRWLVNHRLGEHAGLGRCGHHNRVLR